MMTRNSLLYALLVFCLQVRAGEIKYPVSAIPEILLKDAHVVKRAEERTFEILSGKNTRLSYKKVVTILNENGDGDAALEEFYDKFTQIESIEGYLYDREGKLVKKVKTRDLKDESAVSNISLIDDERVKTHNFYCRNYPYTIEYDVTIDFSQTFYFPPWVPQAHRNYSVEQSKLTVIVPEDYVLRYKMLNYKGAPVEALDKGKRKFEWSITQLPAIREEFAAPRWQERVPMVRLAPSQFEIENYKGSMDSWKDFGKFINSLTQGRDQLPEETRQKVAQLTANVSSEKEKVKILYQFLQQNTRYISIQLGIGDWQPFEASFVAQKGYGDCKALSNYMYSLLKAAGIRSLYTLIKGGEFDHFLMEDFPSNQFNHAILCVPLQKDTMWLECTSQSVPAGYMGEFTGNRKAVVIDENGGMLVSTPRYGLKENTAVRSLTAKLENDATLTVAAHTMYRGVMQDDLSDMIDYLSKEKVKKHLDETLALGTYEINDFKYDKKPSSLPEVAEDLKITVSNYATISGKRLFIIPNILDRGGAKILEEENRTVDYVFDYEFHAEDHEEIEIPEGYVVEAAPADVRIESKYGSYLMSAKLVGNKIVYDRKREQFRGRFPGTEQKEIIKFFDDIYKSDHSRFVLVKASAGQP
ncbi:MAG: DUF3857 domain-containing transglutaminase family protein [Flavisolibacter sp.]